MRVYLALTWQSLAVAWSDGTIPAATPAHAVTPALREWYVDDDVEELEYVATARAARDCLRLLREHAGPSRRVVVAADLADDTVWTASAAPATGACNGTPDVERERSRVVVRRDVEVTTVAAVLLDEPAAQNTVRLAVEALPLAEGGDDDAAFTVDEADGFELLWYAPEEIVHVMNGAANPTD